MLGCTVRASHCQRSRVCSITASPAYLAVHGRPTSLAELAQHQLIWVEDELGPHRGWGLDEVRRSGHAPRFSVNNTEAAVAAAVAGLGVIRTLSCQVTEQLASGQLGLRLAEDNAPRVPVSLLLQGGRRNRAHAPAFIDGGRAH